MSLPAARSGCTRKRPCHSRGGSCGKYSCLPRGACSTSAARSSLSTRAVMSTIKTSLEEPKKPRDFLIKKEPDKPPRPGDVCGCGSGKAFKECCQSKPEALRLAWNERSIRERNIMLQN